MAGQETNLKKNFDSSASQPRRLPVYFLLDVSASMRGEPVRLAVTHIHRLREQLQASSTVRFPIYATVIAYNETAVQLCPLLPCSMTQPPDLSFCATAAAGATLIPAALTRLQTSLATELVRWGKADGDSKPVVVFLTDGGCLNSTDTDYTVNARLQVLANCTTIVVRLVPPSEDTCLINLLGTRVDYKEAKGLDDALNYLEREVQRFQHERQRPICYPTAYTSTTPASGPANFNP